MLLVDGALIASYPFVKIEKKSKSHPIRLFVPQTSLQLVFPQGKGPVVHHCISACCIVALRICEWCITTPLPFNWSIHSVEYMK